MATVRGRLLKNCAEFGTFCASVAKLWTDCCQPRCNHKGRWWRHRRKHQRGPFRSRGLSLSVECCTNFIDTGTWS